MVAAGIVAEEVPRPWTPLGVPEGEGRWWVGPKGQLIDAEGRWVLEWWIGAEDRWYLGSQEVTVRQHLVDYGPVVESSLRVPGGDVTARHWALPSARGGLAMVEIDNASAAPVALALALVPAPGTLGVEQVELRGGELTINGTVVLRGALAPRQIVLVDGGRSSLAEVVQAHGSTPGRDGSVSAADGQAAAALIWPLAHRSAWRVEVEPAGGAPVGPSPTQGEGRTQLREPAAAARPGPDQVSASWTARVDRDVQIELPSGPLAAMAAAQRRFLLLLGGEADRTSRARLVAAQASAGLRDEAAAELGRWLADQPRQGWLGRDRQETAASLWALQAWARTGGDATGTPGLIEAVARAAEAVHTSEAGAGRVGADIWAVAGLRAAAQLLAESGQDRAAGRASRWAEETGVAVRAAPEGLAAWLGVIDPGPERAGLGPAGAAADTWMAADIALRAGRDPAALVEAALAAAGPTWTWLPATGPAGGTRPGADPRAAAAAWGLVRDLLVDDSDRPGPPTGPETAGPVLRLLGWMPPSWLGQAIEVHGLPTVAGRLSYAVRWHGSRPALLWQIDPDRPGEPPQLRAPGLDPTWSGTGFRGEALLAPVDAVGPLVP